MQNGHDPAPITIHRMELIHLPAVRRLYEALIAEKAPVYPTYDTDEYDIFTRAIATALLHADREQRFPAWVACAGDRVIGFGFGEREQRLIGKPKEIVVGHWLIVEPAYRGMGIGRLISQTALAWAQANGVEHVELGAFGDDPQWRMLGWTPTITRYVRTLDKIAEDLAPRPARTSLPVAEKDTPHVK